MASQSQGLSTLVSRMPDNQEGSAISPSSPRLVDSDIGEQVKFFAWRDSYFIERNKLMRSTEFRNQTFTKLTWCADVQQKASTSY